MTLVSSGNGGSNTMSQSNHSPINIIELLVPATFGTTALPGGKFAMLLDEDASHISFLPLTGDGSSGSPFTPQLNKKTAMIKHTN